MILNYRLIMSTYDIYETFMYMYIYTYIHKFMYVYIYVYEFTHKFTFIYSCNNLKAISI
jgi:hypothetical protein